MPEHFSNATFTGGSPSWANACVGDNGEPDVVDYAEGFANAARVLLEQVLEHRGLKYPTDTFVYPICFNMRHAIELYVKAAIEALHALNHHVYRLPPFDTDTSHNIGNLWSYFKEHALAIDRRYQAVVTLLDRDILDFSEVDATGQVFRYPFNRENKKHLTELAIISLRVLATKFPKLVDNLKTLNYHGRVLVHEYRFKTYTSRLSRFDLICIAYRVPPRREWGSVAFNHAKTELKAHFSIGSKEFSLAINLIENNIELAAIIEQPRPFLHVGPTQLGAFFAAWCEFNDLDELKRHFSRPARDTASVVNARDVGEDFDIVAELHADAKAREETWPRFVQELSPEALGEIDALIRFSRDKLEYTEEFERERNITIRDFHASAARGEKAFRQSAFHLLNKPMALAHVLNTLRFFGHVDMVHAVIGQLDLEDSAGHFLENSSNWIGRRYQQASDALGVDLRHPADELL